MPSYYLHAAEKNSYRIMNQTGMRRYVVSNPTRHCACWDAAAGIRDERIDGAWNKQFPEPQLHRAQ